MCVAISGKILNINGENAVVEIMGNKINAAIGLVDAKIGDKVLVHAGCVIQIIEKDEAEEIEEILEEIGELFGRNIEIS
ncbi:MAG: HypC/HybG/HupF family hydrogenase formation chaperone [Oscillospiraceae bacterium]|jgi:hydrogenase expression/formation protein HypC|nr:HypC/HybG/HupF family hydrogenase formation chaperone [Oscillospiraceae bacterium]